MSKNDEVLARWLREARLEHVRQDHDSRLRYEKDHPPPPDPKPVWWSRAPFIRNRAKPVDINGRHLANPNDVTAATKRRVSALPPADGKDVFLTGIWAQENADISKAERYWQAYAIVIKAFHFLSTTEGNPDFMAYLAKKTGWQYRVGTPNDRLHGQAVGCFIHPEWQISRSEEFRDTAEDILGIQQLRADLLVETIRPNGRRERRVVLHRKSMRGGRQNTIPARLLQNQRLIPHLPDDGVVTWVMGDHNCRLDQPGQHPETGPLEEAGFNLVELPKGLSTHIEGGRLDGAFVRGEVNIVQKGAILGPDGYWEEDGIQRSISDHCAVWFLEADHPQFPAKFRPPSRFKIPFFNN